MFTYIFTENKIPRSVKLNACKLFVFSNRGILKLKISRSYNFDY